MAKIYEGLIKQLAFYLTVVFEIALPPVVGFVVGSYADRYLGTSPLLSLVLLAGGLGASIRRLLLLKAKLEKER